MRPDARMDPRDLQCPNCGRREMMCLGGALHACSWCGEVRVQDGDALRSLRLIEYVALDAIDPVVTEALKMARRKWLRRS